MSVNPAASGQPRPKKSKVPIILVIVGAVIGLISLVAIIVSFTGAAGGIAHYAQRMNAGNGSATVRVDAGDKVVVFADANHEIDLGTCRISGVSGPDAANQITESAVPDIHFNTGENAWVAVGAFETIRGDTYSLKCEDKNPVALVPMPDPKEMVGIGAGFGFGFLGGFVGFVIFLVGVIWLIVRHVRGKQRASAAAAQGYGAWQQAGPQQWAQQQNAPQQPMAWQQSGAPQGHTMQQGAWQQPTANAQPQPAQPAQSAQPQQPARQPWAPPQPSSMAQPGMAAQPYVPPFGQPEKPAEPEPPAQPQQ
ncbi:MAG: hypothetical protein MR006_07255 [Arcanobacterium sp.]|nr:hypothetical protein [Arcanobacterium sp.]MDY5588645.1 hypothetical protein [Arcanobacterium sp.]